MAQDSSGTRGNMIRSVVQGCGAYLPQRIVTNKELAQRASIRATSGLSLRSGIRERRIAADGELTSDLALNAATGGAPQERQHERAKDYRPHRAGDNDAR